MTSVFIGQRDLSGTRLILPGAPALDVVGYSHAALGGPKRAEIAVSGGPAALWHLFDTLRCPVVIYNDHMRPVWWGYVNAAEVPYAGMTLRLSLEDMYNRVRVDYEEEAGDDQGLVSETAWSSNSASVTKYGQKEYVRFQSKENSTGAALLRAAELARLKDPIRDVRPGGSGARLLCRGWWDTLDWRYLEFDSLARDGHYYTDTTNAQKGWAANQAMAQAFTPASTFTFQAAAFLLRRTAEIGPLEQLSSLVARLYANSSGSPGSAIATSASLSGLDIGTSFAWYIFQFSAQQTCNSGTTYWIASASVNGDPHYEVVVDEALGYSGAGGLKQLPPGLGSTWYTRSNHPQSGHVANDADMAFLLFDKADSATLAAEIADTLGEFIAGYTVTNSSGKTNTYNREPDNTALEEIRMLLEAGSTNNRRMLAEVREDRYLRVYEEAAQPTDGSTGYKLRADGSLLTAQGQPIDLTTCPVGQWVQFADPLAVDPVSGGPLSYFIEEAECRLQGGAWVWQPRARSSIDPADFGPFATKGNVPD